MLEENSKICTNCGKVVAQSKNINQNVSQNQFTDFDNRSPVEGRTVRQTQRSNVDYRAQQAQRQANRPNTRADSFDTPASQRSRQSSRSGQGYDPVRYAQQNNTPFSANSSSGKENRSRLKPLIFTLIKIIIVIAVLYVGFVFVRVYLVSHGEYEFETTMKLSCENYSEAFDNYFEEGSWKYTLSKNQVSYEGTTKEGEEYVMTFKSENGQVVVSRLVIDGTAVEQDKIMDTYILGMFMAEKKST